MIEFFVSTDGRSIEFGKKWLSEIERALGGAAVELVLCSHESVRRPWINFEAGAGWLRGIVIPVCHTGMRQVDLPPPLSYIQAPRANDPDDLKQIYGLLAKHLGSKVPDADYGQIVAEVQEFERHYGLVSVVRGKLESILQGAPQLGDAFFEAPIDEITRTLIAEHRFDQVEPSLASLQEMGMIECSKEPTVMKVPAYNSDGTMGEGGMMVPVIMRVLASFREIADEVAK
jgi:hypothetical protein